MRNNICVAFFADSVEHLRLLGDDLEGRDDEEGRSPFERALGVAELQQIRTIFPGDQSVLELHGSRKRKVSENNLDPKSYPYGKKISFGAYVEGAPSPPPPLKQWEYISAPWAR